MAYHGKVFDNYFDPTREEYYDIFVHYFNNPIMTKIKNVDGYSMYISKIHAILGIEHRYIIVFVYRDNNILKHKETLKNLKWISIQTRTLTDDYDLQPHSYIPTRLAVLNKNIKLVRKDEKQYIYDVEELPLNIILLPKSKNIDYNSSGNVLSAIETYQTIITFKN
jgi:hypothetical protein